MTLHCYRPVSYDVAYSILCLTTILATHCSLQADALFEAVPTTWDEAKRCNLNLVKACHDNCNNSLEPLLAKAVEQCETDLSTGFFDIFEKCLRRNSFAVTGATRCWDSGVSSLFSADTSNAAYATVGHRRRRQLTEDHSRLSVLMKRGLGVKAYHECFTNCKNQTANYETARCTKSCPSPTTTQLAALTKCDSDGLTTREVAAAISSSASCIVTAIMKAR